VKTECILCGQQMTLRALQKHLGRHQQQLALFALPTNLGDDEDDEQDVQGDNDSDLSSKRAVEDSDVDISDASESEQIHPPLARMLDGSLVPSHISSHHSHHTQSRHSGAHYVEVSPRSSMSSRSSSPSRSEYVYTEREVRPQDRHSYPSRQATELEMANNNLEKMEDTVASTQVENVEVEERSRAHEESSAGTTPYQLRRDHTAGIVREMDRPEEERLDRTIPRSPRIIQADIRIVSIDDEDILRRERTRGDSGGYNGLF